MRAGIAQSVQRLATGRTVRASNPGARFSEPVQTGSGAHPASYTMSTGSFPGVKRPRRGVDHPPPYSAEVKVKVELYLYSKSETSWPVLRRHLPLPLPLLSFGGIFFFLQCHPMSSQTSWSPPPWLWLKCKQLLRLGRPVGAVTLSRRE